MNLNMLVQKAHSNFYVMTKLMYLNGLKDYEQYLFQKLVIFIDHEQFYTVIISSDAMKLRLRMQ